MKTYSFNIEQTIFGYKTGSSVDITGLYSLCSATRAIAEPEFGVNLFSSMFVVNGHE